MISVNVSIPTTKVNELLGNIPVISEISRFANDVNNVAQELSAAKQTTLGGELGQTVNGLESITANNNSLDTGLEKIPSALTVNANVPGLETKLTATISSGSQLGAITGSSVTNGSLNDIMMSAQPSSIKNVLGNITGTVPSYNTVIADIMPENLKQYGASAYAAIDRSTGSVQGIVGSVNAAIGKLNLNVNIAVGDISSNVLDNIALSVDDYIRREVGTLTSGVPGAGMNVAQDLILNKDPRGAIQYLTPYKASGITTEVFEETLSVIPPAPITQTKSFSTAANVFGESTRKQKIVATSGSGWNGANTPSNYEFTSVDSMEEMIAEFRSTTRPITEFVAHWTAHFNDQGQVGAKEIHQISINRSDFQFDGCSYHYIIKKDGTIERGRPVNIQGAHTLNGHNRYSIGIAFVAGYNCNSGTPNYNQFVSAESITPAQMDSFDKFCQAFYLVWPGGQAFGHNDTDSRRKSDPGFDVPEYVKAKFGKTNVIAAIQGPLSPEQLALMQ